jgi:DNA-binding MarR family transcriptional regulator
MRVNVAAFCHDERVQRPRRSVLTVEGMLALESSVSFQVSVLAKLLDRRLARLVVDRFGLTVAEYRVLAQVMLFPRSTVRAIAERTYVDKAQVSRAAAALEAAAYITRDMLDHDRRSPVFTVTRTGKALLNRVLPLRQAQEQEIAAGLDPADLAALQAVLPALIDALGDPGEPTAVKAAKARKQTKPGRPPRQPRRD